LLPPDFSFPVISVERASSAQDEFEATHNRLWMTSYLTRQAEGLAIN